MQTHGGTDAQAAIEAPERYFRSALYVDWSGSGDVTEPLADLSAFTESISTDRALKGSAPEEILLVEGASAASLDVTLGGMYGDTPVAQIFSKYNLASPLYGKKTTGCKITWILYVDTPVGSFRYQQFVGEIRTISPSRANNSVQISALDYVEKLRKPIQLTKWAMHDSSVRWGETDSQVCWSHAIIDMALRQCDVSPGPKRPTTRAEMNVPDGTVDGPQFFLPGNGTYAPIIGWMDHPIYSSFPNRGKQMYVENGSVHPAVANDPDAQPLQAFRGVGALASLGRNFPALPADEGYLSYWAANRDQMPSGGTHMMGLTLNNPQQARAFSKGGGVEILQIVGHASRIYRIMINNGQVWARRTTFRGNTPTDEIEAAETAKVNIPNVTGPVDVFVQWDNTQESGSRCYISCGSNNNLVNGNIPNVGQPVTYVYYKRPYDILGRIGVIQAIDLSDVFYSCRNWYGVNQPRQDQCWRLATYPAVLDRGLNRLSHIPVDKPTEAWRIITDVAAAEFGSVFWDENGVFRFWNQDRMISKQKVIVKEVTLDSLDELNMTDTLDSVRNVFTVEATKARAVFANNVYSSNDVDEFEVPANSTRTFLVWVDKLIAPTTAQFGRYGSQAVASPNNGQPPQFGEGSHGYVLQGYYPAGSQYGEGWYEYNLNLSGVYAVAYFNDQGFLTIRIQNQNSRAIRLAGGLASEPNDDQAALRITGTKMDVMPTYTFTTRNQSSINRYGEKVLALSGPWYQDTYASGSLVTKLMQRTATSIPVTDDIEIPGDPRLQLGDAIMLHDAEGFGANIPVQILGIRRTFSRDGGLRDVLTVEVLEATEFVGDIPVPPSDDKVERVNLAPNPRLGINENGYFSSRQESGRVNNVLGFPGATTAYFATTDVVFPRAQVSAGTPFTASVYVRPSFTGNVTLGIDWYDQDGNYFATGGSKVVTLTNNVVSRQFITASVPAGAVQGLLTASYTGDAYWTQLLYEAEANMLDYFDGSSVVGKTSWDGVVENSISRYLIQEGSDDDENTGGGEVTFRRNYNTNPAAGANTNGYFPPTGLTLTRATGLTGLSRDTGVKLVGVNTSDGVSGPLWETTDAGKAAKVSFQIRNDGSDTLEGQLQVHCKQADGTWIDALGSVDFSIVPGTAARVSTQNFTLPANIGAANAFVYAATQPYTITAGLYELADTDRAYFDGESMMAAWDGQQFNSTSTLGTDDSGGGDPGSGGDGTPPVAEAGTAAASQNWGLPTHWDTFNYTGQPKQSMWSVYGEGGNVGSDGKQCWLGHANVGRRCVEQVELNGQYARLTMLPNGDQAGLAHRYNQQYGKWEVRARVVGKVGATGQMEGHAVLIIWPDDSLPPPTWPNYGEYDFFEVNVNDTAAGAYIHYPHPPKPDGSAVQVYRAFTPGIDITQWHNYAIEWNASGISLYVDGVKQGTTLSGVTPDAAAQGATAIQGMPRGHLTMQIDGFGNNNTLYKEGYFDVAWARVYAP